MVEGNAAIRQSLLILLSTIPGERVYRPDYGCWLSRLVFAPNDETTAGLAIHYVRQAIERWEPRVEILRLDAVSSGSAGDRLDVLLDYRARPTGTAGSLVLPVSLGGPA
jgi:phage baseplate assembly protein W